MEYFIMIIICIIFLIILKFAWQIKLKEIKKVKEIGYDKELNEITNKLPENKEICESILKKLENEKVEIKEEKESKSSFYFVLTNSILIANIKDTFTRVQTIAHECLHSIQNRRTLLFNFVFSNLYFLYFIAICIFSILKMNPFPMIFLFTLVIASFIYYAIRSYLEMDAMTKAKPLAKEYIEEQNKLTKDEIQKIMENYEIINNVLIKLTNFKLIFDCTIKIIIYCIILVILL